MEKRWGNLLYKKESVISEMKSKQKRREGGKRGLQAGWHGQPNPDLSDRPLTVSPPPPPSGCSVAFFIPSHPAQSLSLPRCLSALTLPSLCLNSMCTRHVFLPFIPLSAICSPSPSPRFGGMMGNLSLCTTWTPGRVVMASKHWYG